MSKKYRLKINYSEITEENFETARKLRQFELVGKTCIRKQADDGSDIYLFKEYSLPLVIQIGWLTEIKEPFEEAWLKHWSEYDNKDPLVSPYARFKSGWNAALENQKLEKVVDDMIMVKRGVYEDDNKFLESLFEKIGISTTYKESKLFKIDINSERKELIPICSDDLCFVFSEALKYARGIS